MVEVLPTPMYILRTKIRISVNTKHDDWPSVTDLGRLATLVKPPSLSLAALVLPKGSESSSGVAGRPETALLTNE